MSEADDEDEDEEEQEEIEEAEAVTAGEGTTLKERRKFCPAERAAARSIGRGSTFLALTLSVNHCVFTRRIEEENPGWKYEVGE